jgi:hypothetical protein
MLNQPFQFVSRADALYGIFESLARMHKASADLRVLTAAGRKVLSTSRDILAETDNLLTQRQQTDARCPEGCDSRKPLLQIEAEVPEKAARVGGLFHLRD